MVLEIHISESVIILAETAAEVVDVIKMIVSINTILMFSYLTFKWCDLVFVLSISTLK